MDSKLILATGLVTVALLFMSGCITAPDGRKGIGVGLPVKIKTIDLGTVVVGWIPPDSVLEGRYGAAIQAGKAIVRAR